MWKIGDGRVHGFIWCDGVSRCGAGVVLVAGDIVHHQPVRINETATESIVCDGETGGF